jgi:hypothetical protein
VGDALTYSFGWKIINGGILPFCSLKVLPNGKRHFDLPLKNVWDFKVVLKPCLVVFQNVKEGFVYC